MLAADAVSAVTEAVEAVEQTVVLTTTPFGASDGSSYSSFRYLRQVKGEVSFMAHKINNESQVSEMLIWLELDYNGEHCGLP